MIKIVLEIPDEFERDFYKDYFKDSIERVITDIITSARCKGYYELAGLYEIEVLEMLMKALVKSDIYDMVAYHEFHRGYTAGYKAFRSLMCYANNDKRCVKDVLNSIYGIQGAQNDKDSKNKDR